MKKYKVIFSIEASADLEQIYHYVCINDSVGKADALLDKLEALYLSLDCQPKRGHVLPEMDRAGIKRFLEVHYKPYRIIYEVLTDVVMLHGFLDGRQDLNDLLENRLLRRVD